MEILGVGDRTASLHLQRGGHPPGKGDTFGCLRRYRRLILSMTHEPADRRTYALPYANCSARLPMTLTTAASGPVATGRENPKTILDAGQRAQKALMSPQRAAPDRIGRRSMRPCLWRAATRFESEKPSPPPSRWRTVPGCPRAMCPVERAGDRRTSRSHSPTPPPDQKKCESETYPTFG